MTISMESNIEYGSLDFLVWIHVLCCIEQPWV